MEPNGGVAEFLASEVVAEVGASSRARICLSSSVGVRGCDSVWRAGWIAVWVSVADDLQIYVVGVASASRALSTSAAGIPVR